MPTWPSSLPQKPEQQGFLESPPDLTLATDMDVGPAKLRRRFTAGVRVFDFNVLLDNTQVDTLDSFYLTDVAGGALSFDLPDPRASSGTISVRFIGPPQYSNVGGPLYRATMKFEKLP